MSGYCYVKNNSAYRLVVFVFRHLLKTNAGALLHPASTVNKSSGSVFLGADEIIWNAPSLDYNLD